MGDSDQFDDVYEDNNPVMLALEFDGESVRLMLKIQKAPGIEQSGTIWAKKTSEGKYVLDFGIGDEEYDSNDLPNPIMKLIGSRGGGPNGNSVQLPPKKALIRSDFTIRSYAEYCSDWASRRNSGRSHDKPLPKKLFHQLAKLYLKKMGMPLYL